MNECARCGEPYHGDLRAEERRWIVTVRGELLCPKCQTPEERKETSRAALRVLERGAEAGGKAHLASLGFDPSVIDQVIELQRQEVERAENDTAELEREFGDGADGA